MNRQRRIGLAIHLSMPRCPVSVDTLRAVTFTAAACNVHEGTPVDVLAIIAGSGRAIVWC